MTHDQRVVGAVPLSTLLSQALVAYTIEFDNLAEQRIHHGTTVGGRQAMKTGGIWFGSQVMWTNYVRHISEGGTPVLDVQALACDSASTIKSRLHHLEWWLCVTVDHKAKTVKLTPNGTQAARGWATVGPDIDRRWTKRFGKTRIDALTKSLRANVRDDVPDYMPVCAYQDGMRASIVLQAEAPPRTPIAKLGISALLSRVLLDVTLAFEAKSNVSLVAVANLLRVVDDDGTAQKDLPLRAGIAKEGQLTVAKFLAKKGYLSVGTDKLKTVRLTTKGKQLRDEYPHMMAKIEKRFHKGLRDALQAIVAHPKFVDGLRPPEGGWRWDKRYIKQTEATLANPRAALPHHPMITHRGGFPDGC